MNTKKILALAKEVGLEDVSVQENLSTSISVSLFDHVLDSYEYNDVHTLLIKGVYNNRFGVVALNKFDEASVLEALKEAKLSASKIEREEEAIIFRGSPKYKRRNVFNKQLDETPLEAKINLIRQIEDKLSSDPRIESVNGVSYSEEKGGNSLFNSKGLNLKSQSNYFVIMSDVSARGSDGVLKAAYAFEFGNDLNTFDIDVYVKKVIDEVVRKLDAKPIKTKKYPTILNPKVTATFLKVLTSWLSAEKVQKHSSLLEGKLDETVISKKLTILEDPHANNVFFTSYDDEGVATKKKVLFDKGVLKTYLYNLETAKKDGVESTGNGFGSGKIGIGTRFLTIKPSRKNEEELISSIKEGVYITEVKGLHSGLDATSGDFSLESEGFLIKDGKLASPISSIALSGNVLELFRNVTAIANNLTLNLNATATPSIKVKAVQVSGE